MSLYRVIDVPQRSTEWHSARCGRLTASSAGDVLATVKSGEAAARRNLRTRLVLERLTGKVREGGYQSAAMQRGIELEPMALSAYEALTGHLVTTVGFLAHTDLPIGCSPDGIVDTWPDGSIRVGLELKCPEDAAHLEYWRTGNIGRDYEAQILHSMWVTGAEAWHWMSFHPDFPPSMRTIWKVYTRDGVAAYVEKATAFLAEVDAEERDIRARLETGHGI